MGTFADQLSFAAELEAVHAEAFPCVIVLQGDFLDAAQGTSRTKTKITKTGIVEVRVCTFRILKTALAAEPVRGATFHLEGESRLWMIAQLAAGRGVSDAAWVIDCEEANKP